KDRIGAHRSAKSTGMDPAKRQFAEELLLYSDSFNMVMYKAMPAKGDVSDEVGHADLLKPFESDVALNKIEDAFSKFNDGPFLLGQFSLVCENLDVDIAYAPFIERFQTFFLDVKSYDITKGRPNLSSWIEVFRSPKKYKAIKLAIFWSL
ncbi:hypothetical protein BHE74_00024420, partial [Ensete ventricosum]